MKRSALSMDGMFEFIANIVDDGKAPLGVDITPFLDPDYEYYKQLRERKKRG